MGIVQTNTHIPDYYPFHQERDLLRGKNSLLKKAMATGYLIADRIIQESIELVYRYQESKARKSLYSLSDDELLDIGICRADIEHLFLNHHEAD